MSIKVISESQAPSRKQRTSICHELPEWDETMMALGTLQPGKIIEVTLSKESLSKIGVSKNKTSYFGQQLRVFFKNARMPVTAWTRSFPDGSEACYVQRLAVPALHKKAAS